MYAIAPSSQKGFHHRITNSSPPATIVDHRPRVAKIQFVNHPKTDRFLECMNLLVNRVTVSTLNRHVELFVAGRLQGFQQVAIRTNRVD
ncbi:hypothetical protein Pla52n_39950 [Stieleria varia]|uniref:Uncharacterized protein n=1 Tax=Stieleria varia TaxID=2528005 RepID=A0A5C6ATV7_9BACT|nr:hypothetical protein Pla52n_39950 [Stieleria varia]